MKKLSGWHLRGAAIVLLCAAGGASAADLGFYAVVEGAVNTANIPLSKFNSEVSAYIGTPSVVDTAVDTHVNGFNLTVGYQLGSYFAIEGSYIIFGNPRYEYSTLPPQNSSDPPSLAGRLKVKSGGPTVSAVGLLPLGDYFSLDAHAGFFFVDSKYNISLGTESDSVSDSNTALYVGAGAAWWITGQVALRVGYNRFHNAVFRQDASQYTLGIRYSYGY